MLRPHGVLAPGLAAPTHRCCGRSSRRSRLPVAYPVRLGGDAPFIGRVRLRARPLSATCYLGPGAVPPEKARLLIARRARQPSGRTLDHPRHATSPDVLKVGYQERSLTARAIVTAMSR